MEKWSAAPDNYHAGLIAQEFALAAIRELKGNEKGIGDIFYRRCGFNDYSSFYRVIKKYTGMKLSDFFD